MSGGILLRRLHRRAGISNLIGAIFFILIVALLISTLTLVFNTTSSYIGGIHSSNQLAQQEANSYVTIKNVTYGAVTNDTYVQKPVPVYVGLTASEPFLYPVSNMNFTGGMSGWYLSESYPFLYDAGQVSNIATTSAVLPASESFDLTVQNNNLAGSNDWIGRITLLADTNLTSPASAGTPVGWVAKPVVGNNVTWTPAATPYGTFGIAPGPSNALTFGWSANVPASLGTFYETIVISWYLKAPPLGSNGFVDSAIATIQTPTTTSGSQYILVATPFMANIIPTTSGLVPGGLNSGYDGTGLTAASRSGPGSVYVTFEPRYNAQAVPTGEQIEGVSTLSTSFSLSSKEASLIPMSDCCTLSWDSVLDGLSSTNNALIYYQFFLTGPAGSVEINSNGCTGTFSPYVGWTNPTLANYFGPSGWALGTSCFSPPPGFWLPGSYTLTLAITEFMPSGLPSASSMHFDNMGLALGLQNSAYAEQDLSMSLATNVQSGSYSIGTTQTVLTDGGATWLPGEWRGDYLLYDSGPNTGQSLLITGNTLNTISTAPASFLNAPSVNGGDGFTIQSPLNATAVQGIQLGLNMTGVSPSYPDTVAYVYVADNSLTERGGPGPVIWLRVADVTFNQSATAQAFIPLPQAEYYIDSSGKLDLQVVVVAPGGASPQCDNAPTGTTCFPLLLSAYAVVQVESQPGAVAFTITNTQGSAPIHLASLYISGPNQIGSFTISNWLNAGSTIVLCRGGSDYYCPGTFDWVPGQTYLVTVTTAQGVSYSRSYTAPG